MSRTISAFQFPSKQRGEFILGLPVDGEIVHVQPMSADVIGVFASHQNLGAPLINRPLHVLRDGEIMDDQRYRDHLGTWFDGADGWLHLVDVTPKDSDVGTTPAAATRTAPAAETTRSGDPRPKSTVGVSTVASTLRGRGTTPPR